MGSEMCIRDRDDGQTWESIRVEKDLRLWAPRMNRLNASTLIVTGRDIRERATVAWFSDDSGRTWQNELVVDRPRFSGSYAYTDSINAKGNRFWVFTSSPPGWQNLLYQGSQQQITLNLVGAFVDI